MPKLVGKFKYNLLYILSRHVQSDSVTKLQFTPPPPPPSKDVMVSKWLTLQGVRNSWGFPVMYPHGIWMTSFVTTLCATTSNVRSYQRSCEIFRRIRKGIFSSVGCWILCVTRYIQMLSYPNVRGIGTTQLLLRPNSRTFPNSTGIRFQEITWV